MNPQEMNYVVELMQAAKEIRALQIKAQELLERWQVNGFAQRITDQKLVKVSTLQHLSAQKIQDVLAVMTSILEVSKASVGEDGAAPTGVAAMLALVG
ncbi:MAG: hypothetical protein IAE83_20955 [Anaerolinea sp.]|nr:hypothetical protein [Anaerolinea sp.]